MAPSHFFVVTGRAGANRLTYNCPTAEWALRKLRDFRAAGRSEVSVVSPDGTVLAEDDLIRLIGEVVALPAETLSPQAQSEPVLS